MIGNEMDIKKFSEDNPVRKAFEARIKKVLDKECIEAVMVLADRGVTPELYEKMLELHKIKVFVYKKTAAII